MDRGDEPLSTFGEDDHQVAVFQVAFFLDDQVLLARLFANDVVGVLAINLLNKIVLANFGVALNSPPVGDHRVCILLAAEADVVTRARIHHYFGTL